MNITQNTSRATQQQYNRVLIGLASIVLAGAAFAAPWAATADRITEGGDNNVCLPPPNTASDIDEVVTQRKIAMAQDRIDRAWLYR